MKFTFTFLLIVVAFFAYAQTKKIKSFTASDDVTSAAVDRAGDFYLVLKTGEIQKFDKNGVKLFSYKGAANLTAFDPTNAIRLLVYYASDTNYAWLSPSLENPGLKKIDDAWAIDPYLLCPSGDLNLWILDAADWSLKKVNPNQPSVISEFVITKAIPKPEIHKMREYLNFIFLLDTNQGFYIFNSLGKLIRKIEAKKVSSFNFLGEELYYQIDNTIYFFDLYTAEQRTIQLPEEDCHWVLLTDERMLIVKEENEVEVFEYKP